MDRNCCTDRFKILQNLTHDVNILGRSKTNSRELLSPQHKSATASMCPIGVIVTAGVSSMLYSFPFRLVRSLDHQTFFFRRSCFQMASKIRKNTAFIIFSAFCAHLGHLHLQMKKQQACFRASVLSK